MRAASDNFWMICRERASLQVAVGEPRTAYAGCKTLTVDVDSDDRFAAHSGRLIYAKPENLPSFPSVGVKPNGSAAGAAATLGWHNKKSPEPWFPEKSATASAAAVLAKDHKMAALWSPEPSSQGAQAAMLAHKASKSFDSPKTPTTDNGHSAAAHAYKADRSPTKQSRSEALDRKRSLMAAKGAMTTRPRASSTPISRPSYPDEANAASNAMKAATKANRPTSSSSSSAKDSKVTPYTNMNRQMFTSHPAFQTVIHEDKKREDELHASALAMAKKIYTQQQRVIDQTKKAHAHDRTQARGRRRSLSSSSDEDEIQPMQFGTLQDTAYKLAQERLARMHEENMKNRDYKDYYGQSGALRRFSVRGKLRRRASSDGDVVEDRKRSQQIRKQMSIFSTKLSAVDEKKRQRDRDAVLAAAHRNVQAKLKDIDDKITKDTGMVPPSNREQWEGKAKVVAQVRSDNRMSNHGKVDVGAGKFMAQEDIDAIAARKVQPVLDEINEKAEKEQARQTELKLEAERQKEQKEIEKQRDKEVQEAHKKLKEQDKQEAKERKAEEKRDAKARKEAAKAEQKRQKAEKRQSEHVEPTQSPGEQEPVVLGAPVVFTSTEVDQPGETAETAEATETARPHTPVVEPSQPTPIQINKEHSDELSNKSPASSPTGKVRTWFKSHFRRGSSKSEDDKDKPKKDKGKRPGFIGGAALTQMPEQHSAVSLTSTSPSVDNQSASMKAVAMAGRQHSHLSASEISPAPAIEPNPDDVSSLSSSSDNEHFIDAPEGPRSSASMGAERASGGLSPPKPIQDPAKRKSVSPGRDSRFHEII